MLLYMQYKVDIIISLKPVLAMIQLNNWSPGVKQQSLQSLQFLRAQVEDWFNLNYRCGFLAMITTSSVMVYTQNRVFYGSGHCNCSSFPSLGSTQCQFRTNEALCQLSYEAPYLDPEGGRPGRPTQAVRHTCSVNLGIVKIIRYIG